MINNIYSRLVKGDNDIAGIIAYAFYKKHKMEWIQEYAEHYGTAPDPDQMRSFFEQASGSVSLSGYQEQAKAVLNSYSASMQKEMEEVIEGIHEEVEEYTSSLEQRLDEEINNIEDSLTQQYTDKLAEAINNIHKESYYHGIIKSVLGSIFFVIFVGVVYFFVSALKLNPIESVKNTVQEVVQVDMNQTK